MSGARHARNGRGRCNCHCCKPGRQGGALGDGDDRAADPLGDSGFFWELCNEITDTYDADMMERLNSGLDNLLIFVSGLSPSPRPPC